MSQSAGMANFGRLRLVSPAKLIFLSLALLWCDKCDRVETADSLPLPTFALRPNFDNNVNAKADPETRTETILSMLGGMACNGRTESDISGHRLGFCVGSERLLSSTTERLQGLQRHMSAPVCAQQVKISTDFLRPMEKASGRVRRRVSERSPSAGAQSTVSSQGDFSYSRKRARGFGSRLVEQPVTSSTVVETMQRRASKTGDFPSAMSALVSPGVARSYYDSSEEDEEENEEMDKAREMEQWSEALERGERQVLDQWASFELEHRRLTLGVAGARRRLLRELRNPLEAGLPEQDEDEELELAFEEEEEEERDGVLRPPDQWRVNPGFVAAGERGGADAGDAESEEEQDIQDMYVLSNPAQIRALSVKELARAGVVARGEHVREQHATRGGCRQVERREGETVLAVDRKSVV